MENRTTIAMGASKVQSGLTEALSDPEGSVPEALHGVLGSVMREVADLEERIGEVEKQLGALWPSMPLVELLDGIPGVGVMNATALSALTGDFSRFSTGRKFACSLGLTAKEHSSGKRRWLGAISKAGDTYLRTLLIGGARSVLNAAHRTKRPGRLHEWALEVERRRGTNRAAVAVANKLARIVWAVATHGVPYRGRPVEVKSAEVPPA